MLENETCHKTGRVSTRDFTVFIFFHYSPLWMILIQERKKINQQQQPSWGETSSHIFCRTHQHNKRQNKAAILCCCNLKSNNFHHQSKLYISSTLNIHLLLAHKLVVCAVKWVSRTIAQAINHTPKN